MLSVKIVMSFWKIAARFGIAADTTLLPKAIHSVAIAAVAVIVLWVVQIGHISKVFFAIDAVVFARAKADFGDNIGRHSPLLGSAPVLRIPRVPFSPADDVRRIMCSGSFELARSGTLEVGLLIRDVVRVCGRQSLFQLVHRAELVNGA